MKRIIDKESVVGTYMVLEYTTEGNTVATHTFVESFVKAEELAAKAAHDRPGRHVMVALISLQLVGTPHVTVSEVIPEARPLIAAPVIPFPSKGQQ